MKSKVKVVNMEAGMPTVAEAEKRLDFEITTARRQGIAVLKIIHGYGSSGTGGRLKSGLRRFLADKQARGGIKSFVAGDNWSIFDAATRAMLEQCGELRNDTDLDRYNHGITMVLL